MLSRARVVWRDSHRLGVHVDGARVIAAPLVGKSLREVLRCLRGFCVLRQRLVSLALGHHSVDRPQESDAELARKLSQALRIAGHAARLDYLSRFDRVHPGGQCRGRADYGVSTEYKILRADDPADAKPGITVRHVAHTQTLLAENFDQARTVNDLQICRSTKIRADE